MWEHADSYLSQINKSNATRRNIRQAILALSLIVAIGVFWGLKLTGITMAGEAFCGKAEHAHSEECVNCILEEHIHDTSCYSDISADLETSKDWEMAFAGMANHWSTPENVVEIARSQLGYRESTLNFQVDANGIRRGIVRYGQWYGNPYGDWSTMFVSFCLHYAGVDDLPTNAGPEAMRVEWEQAGLYKPAEEFAPRVGNLVFLHKGALPSKSAVDVAANSVAIITGFSGDTITVIEGDVDHSVQEVTYSVLSPAVMGYGLVPDRSELTILADTTADGAVAIAKTTVYEQSLFTDTNCFVVYTVSGENYYAFDGTGNAVQIYIDSDGNILSDVADPNTLLWTFSGSDGTYIIQNLSSGRYMHAYPNNGSGVTTAGAYSSTLIESGEGVKIRSNSEYAKLDTGAGKFVMTQDANAAAVYQFGMVSRCTVWLDGTDGGLSHLTGSRDQGYTLQVGDVFLLPTEWDTPAQYGSRLKGWYDVINSVYYQPGDAVTVTGNMVFYADWVAETYDVGQYNAYVANTVSTNEFITTHVFDYNYLFNILSANAEVTVNASGHSEVWSIVTNGNVDYLDQESLNFVFIDYDGNGAVDKPNNRQTHNTYPGSGIVTDGIYSLLRAQALFGTSDALGRTYLGTGDHLFQIMTDPNDEHYGYYYYDSQRNAASYNQSQGRFYVYEYLEATSAAIGSSYSGFLPFNSPYANTNSNNTGSYTYDGINGEYTGVSHIEYASGYADADQVMTNFAFGMQMDVRFYLPDDPGTGGNKDIHGNNMHFHFSGDDDVWVLIDGQLVLDIGGIHGIESGDINFADGVISVNGETTGNLSDYGITAGEHVMTVLYLERGASQSNCAIYFNLAPRYSLDIQKEDVLTQQLLNGAKFSVYTDAACTVAAELYTSEAAYRQGAAPTNTFTVTNGIAHMWGLSPSKTYYIKETGPPDAAGYSIAQGTIQITIDKDGLATYHVEVVDDPSPGFAVHGVRIDEETQRVYIVVTNAPDTVTDTTTVQVYKKWEDDADHSGDYISAYLTVTDPDGTIRRIREILLSNENGWKYTWTNLPKYDYDTLTEVQYGIEESYESGFYSTVRRITQISVETTTWAEAYKFVDGETYLLKTASGCLATTSASATTLTWMDEEVAKTSQNCSSLPQNHAVSADSVSGKQYHLSH